ncbi:ABC transporter, variant [Loa loa]|uniref:ABC-type antigen peptide transporter n=1 Tax=Loa loa TaxID=7209 RepID=A0A1S0UKV8_LOALO|nr:ABC transporter [Loa loa]XP_020306298.1 ABC transporter, variant [Loa loa]EJD75434.1 ABC transporter [Loa loa]EJD75435.1 ABC transporter, variant [Loa loa]
MRFWLPSFLIILYCWVDVIISVIAFGFYQTSFKFDLQIIWDYITFNVPYHFITSPIDFLLFTAFRLLVMLILLMLKVNCENPWHEKFFIPLLGVFILNWTFSLIKLLAFSEKIEQFVYFGFWLNVIWNVLAAALIILFWNFVLRTNTSWSYRSLTGDAQDVTSRLQDTKEESDRFGTGQHILRLLRYCKNHWKWFAAGFFFLTVYSSSRVFLPYCTGRVLSNIVQARGAAVLVNSVLLMSALTVVSTITGGLRGGSFVYATALVNRQMRYDLFSSLVEQDISFFDTTNTGEITSRLTTDCETMSSTISTNLNIFLRNIVMLLGSLVFMATLSWRLSLVTFIIVPVVGFVTKVYGAYYDLLTEKTQATIAVSNHVAEQVVSTMRTVRSFACEKREARKFQQHLDETLHLSRKKAIVYMGYMWTTEFCDNAILIAVLFYGGHLVLSGKMTVDNLISFLLYQMQLGENLYNISYVFTGLMESVGASRKVFEYMMRKPKILRVGTKKTPINGEVKFDSVSFTYASRPNNPVLQDVSFTVHPGQTVALVGPSGGGKSSIVSLIEHFYECDKGCVLIDGNPVADYDHEYIHQKIALVAQDPILYEGTVRDNIIYGCDWATEDDVLNAAKIANAHNFIMETEKQYDTNCGERGIQLSGGQKQRIAIARALVRHPAILILDEATSALDAESEHVIQDAIARCSKDKTVIVIAHRLSTVENADQIIVISKGQVVQQGRHENLLEQDGIYRALVHRQLLGHSSSKIH